MPLIGDIFDIPAQVHQGDFVLRLTEGVERPADTLSTYVVTPQLVICFDQALSLIKSALETRSSKGAYLHGSFGSGKSHFMAVLTLLLQRHPEARAIPELASVVTKHNAWTQGRKFLVVPYHMIGAISLESAVLGQYADYVRRRHPKAPTPGFYQGERLFADARRLRAAMGDAAFFTRLGRDQEADSGWGSLGSGWDAESFEAAMEAPPTSDERIRLVGDLVDAFFQSARDLAVTGSEGFVALDEGLSIMSKHAQALGYDAVVLFLDELILWLASHAGDLPFINREGQKVAKLVEAMTADRPIPIVSFIARQRDLRELVGEHLPGAEHLGFADVLNWWEARFDQIILEDRNLPAIVEKRLLRPKSPQAARQLQEAFEKTARVRDEVMNTLLTRAGDRDMFRQVYPFSPALVQTLVAISSLLQRERTALKLLLLLLVNQRDSLELGDLVPVGDLFDVIAEGDEPFTQAMRINFDNAKKLYRQKLLPMLEGEQGITAPDVKEGRVEATRAQRFRNDDRLLKTLILSALAPEVEALHALTPSRLAALNHGTVRSPIPGQEGAIVLQRCRNWAAQVGEIKVSDDGPNPTISLHIVGVDTDGILANAQSFDSYGNRIQKIRSLLFEQLALDPDESSLLPPRYQYPWRGTWRTCEILFQNVRELPLDSLRAQDPWRMVIDYPFDREGRTPRDDHAQVQLFQATGESSNGLVWLPCFFSRKTLEDLGRLVLLDHILSGNNLSQYGGHLSQVDREQARVLLQNQRDQMRQRLRNAMLAAYGIST
ncbi:MAG TPA: phage resistance protein, partial [Candidatus Tectomicrobia bacterium]|nr:phage resistance protein [Candidatus Tectomicrobia bacterium]